MRNGKIIHICCIQKETLEVKREGARVPPIFFLMTRGDCELSSIRSHERDVEVLTTITTHTATTH